SFNHRINSLLKHQPPLGVSPLLTPVGVGEVSPGELTQMLAGMVVVNNLSALGIVVGHPVPDPSSPVARKDLISKLFDVIRQLWEKLAGFPQMGYIGRSG